MLAKVHEKVANTRKDFHHEPSFKLVHKYSLIAVEDLQLKELIEMSDQRLNKPIHDAGWSSSIMMLCNKAESAGCRVIKAEPKGTTQECSRCVNIVPKTLRDRRHHCPRCGLSIDGDMNAAINILKRALLLSSTAGHTGSQACGAALKGGHEAGSPHLSRVGACHDEPVVLTCDLHSAKLRMKYSHLELDATTCQVPTLLINQRIFLGWTERSVQFVAVLRVPSGIFDDIIRLPRQ